MLHGLWLENGKAKHYRNRWVQTSLIKENKSPSLDKVDNMSSQVLSITMVAFILLENGPIRDQ